MKKLLKLRTDIFRDKLFKEYAEGGHKITCVNLDNYYYRIEMLNIIQNEKRH